MLKVHALDWLCIHTVNNAYVQHFVVANFALWSENTHTYVQTHWKISTRIPHFNHSTLQLPSVHLSLKITVKVGIKIWLKLQWYDRRRQTKAFKSRCISLFDCLYTCSEALKVRDIIFITTELMWTNIPSITLSMNPYFPPWLQQRNLSNTAVTCLCKHDAQGSCDCYYCTDTVQ